MVLYYFFEVYGLLLFNFLRISQGVLGYVLVQSRRFAYLAQF